MRIVVVTHAYPRHRGDLAGAFIAQLNAALVRRGHTVSVVLPTDAGRAGESERDGVQLDWTRYDTPARETLAYRGTMAEALRSPRGLLTFWRMLRALERALADRARDADVIHAHWWVPGGIAAERAVRYTDTPLVVTMHGTDVAMLGRVPLAPRLARRVFRRARAVTAVSSWLGTRARTLSGFTGSVDVQPMPILASAGSTIHAATPTRVVTFVGRLTPQKRVHLAIDALRHLPADVRLVIVGDGVEREGLERRAAPLGNRVQFVGGVAPDAVAPWLDQSDAFVFPAEGEGYGLAVAEAVLRGLPVVATTDGGGVGDIVTPEAGRLVAPDAGALGDALQAILADGTARSRAAVAGEVLANQLDPDAVAARFESLYAGGSA